MPDGVSGRLDRREAFLRPVPGSGPPIYCRFSSEIAGASILPLTQRPQQGAAAMTDRSHEIAQDDLRNLVRVVSACTLGLWSFAAGLLIGVFLFS